MGSACSRQRAGGRSTSSESATPDSATTSGARSPASTLRTLLAVGASAARLTASRAAACGAARAGLPAACMPADARSASARPPTAPVTPLWCDGSQRGARTARCERFPLFPVRGKGGNASTSAQPAEKRRMPSAKAQAAFNTQLRQHPGSQRRTAGWAARAGDADSDATRSASRVTGRHGRLLRPACMRSWTAAGTLCLCKVSKSARSRRDCGARGLTMAEVTPDLTEAASTQHCLNAAAEEAWAG